MSLTMYRKKLLFLAAFVSMKLFLLEQAHAEPLWILENPIRELDDDQFERNRMPSPEAGVDYMNGNFRQTFAVDFAGYSKPLTAGSTLRFFEARLKLATRIVNGEAEVIGGKVVIVPIDGGFYKRDKETGLVEEKTSIGSVVTGALTYENDKVNGTNDLRWQTLGAKYFAEKTISEAVKGFFGIKAYAVELASIQVPAAVRDRLQVKSRMTTFGMFDVELAGGFVFQLSQNVKLMTLLHVGARPVATGDDRVSQTDAAAKVGVEVNTRGNLFFDAIKVKTIEFALDAEVDASWFYKKMYDPEPNAKCDAGDTSGNCYREDAVNVTRTNTGFNIRFNF